MYSLMASTRDRAGFTLRSKEYFSGYWRLHAAAGQGQLFFASLDGEVLAGVFATYIGSKAWYKDGGSTKEHQSVMAPHLLQWEVMRWLKSRGIDHYDLVAVPSAADLNPEHPLYGLYRFKSGFSDRITEFVGTWDLPIRRRAYACLESRRRARGAPVVVPRPTRPPVLMFSPFGFREFRLLFAARVISLTGSAIAPIALAFGVLQATGQVTDLGIVLFARQAIETALLLGGGVLADRFPGGDRCRAVGGVLDRRGTARRPDGARPRRRRCPPDAIAGTG